MQKKQISLLKSILFHILFWTLVWFFFYGFFSVGASNKEFLFWFSTILSVITLVASYVFIYDLIPKYLLTKQNRKFSIYTIYSAVFVTTAVLITVAFGFVFYKYNDISMVVLAAATAGAATGAAGATGASCG